MENKLYNKIKEALLFNLKGSFLCTKCIERESDNDFAKVTYTIQFSVVQEHCRPADILFRWLYMKYRKMIMELRSGR